MKEGPEGKEGKEGYLGRREGRKERGAFRKESRTEGY
jgi:hypothetical protein